MLWLTIKGVAPYDGRYELDIEDAEFTTREWGWIKRLTGYMPLTIEQGFTGGDPELFAVFAVIAMRRAGKVDDPPAVYERLADGPAGTSITLENDQAEEPDDADPPLLSSNGSDATSGAASPTGSASSEPTLSPSGIPGSGSSGSPPTASGS